MIEGTLQPGMRVAVFDDVVTTGGALKQAIDQIEAAQGIIVKASAIVDRREGARQNFAPWGYPYHAFFTIGELKAARPSRPLHLETPRHPAGVFQRNG